MPSVTKTSEFMDTVRKSGILNDKQFADRYPDESVLPESPSECAALLIEEGFLTSYQAKLLLLGKFRGLRLGPYKILQPLGQGGIGMVFLAEHLSLQRKVAIKVLSTDKAKENLCFGRFQREARAAAALDHPNIMRLYDISQQAGVHFLVMEYVEGTDLHSFMGESGALHYVQAVQYIAQAAAGLQHAHEKGFVHRDIKPSNLMVTKEGTIKILDMGLARSFLNEEDKLTEEFGEEAKIAGTVDYVSPEQSLGMLVNERSDIYSLGVTLFNLITGHPPYRGTKTQKLAQHQMAEPPRLDKINPAVPPELSDVLAKMMAKKPSDRYQSMGDVIRVLTTWSSRSNTTSTLREPLIQPSTQQMVSTQNQNNQVTKRIPKKNENQYLLVGIVVMASMLIIGMLITVVSRILGSNRNILYNSTSQHLLLANSQPDLILNTEPIEVKGELSPIDLSSVVTGCTLTVIHPEGIYDERSLNKIRLANWGPRTVLGIPFDLIDPSVARKPNAIILNSTKSPIQNSLPLSVVVPINTEVRCIHVLGGICTWGWPHKEPFSTAQGTVSVVVRIRYADESIEEQEWKNGEQIVDYFKLYSTPTEVPGSRLAILDDYGNQIRYLGIRPEKKVTIREIEFTKGPTDQFTGPIIFAMTLEKEPK
jgi:serine/threonine protein kinase